jgi:hypothetical protein
MPMFVPLYNSFQLLFFSTNEQLTLPSSNKLVVDHVLPSVKIALLSIDSSKKLKPAMPLMLNMKRHTKSLSPPA